MRNNQDTNDNKIEKFRKKKTPQIGAAIFVLIFIYIIINVVLYYRKDHISIYEVQADNLSDDYVYTGIITRDEVLVESDSSGYINTYVADKSRVSKGAPVYSLSSMRINYDTDNMNLTISDTNLSDIKSTIYRYHNDFNLSKYSSIEDYKQGVLAKYNEIYELSLYSKLIGTGEADNLGIMQSNISGVVSYNSDNFAGIKAEQVTSKTFETDNYKTWSLRTAENVNPGDEIYRIVTDDRWNIVLKVDEDFYLKNLETKGLDITIVKDNYNVSAEASFEKRGDGYFVVLSLVDCMVRYIDDRFIDVQISCDSVSGLKIPLSAITTKEFYTIPNEYIIRGDSDNETYVELLVTDSETGEQTYEKNQLNVYYETDELSYVDGMYIDAGAYIKNAADGSTFRITDIERLEGVFCVNQGYAVFRRIERLDSNDTYCLIRDNTKYGLSLYDHIALDAETVTESALIY